VQQVSELVEQWPRWRGAVRVIIRDAHSGRFLRGGRTLHNLIVNSGLNLLRDGLIGAATDTQIHYVAIGTGCGVLATGLTNGQTGITALAMSAGIPFALGSGASLTLMNGASSQVITTSSSVSAGATSIPVTSFTANANYPATTSSVTPTPATSDTTLHNETFRKAVTVQSAGGAGVATTTLFLSPQDAVSVIAELGWFAGVSATSTPGSGAMVARVLYNHQHTNLESVQSVRTDTL
jgi:hypothetical protein